MKVLLLSTLGFAAFASTSFGTIISIFTDDDSAFDVTQGTVNESYALESATPGFGNGNIMHLTDQNNASSGTTGVKVKSNGFTTPLFETVQIHMDIMNLALGVSNNSDAFKIRFSNADSNINSSSGNAIGIEYRQDSELRLQGGVLSGDESLDDAYIQDTLYELDIFANFSVDTPSTYTFGDQVDRGLLHQHYDLFINGVLFNTSDNVNFEGGSFDSAGGLTDFGLFMDSNKTGGEWLIDNIQMAYGSDLGTNLSAAAVPEPSTIALLFGFLTLGFAVRRRSSK